MCCRVCQRLSGKISCWLKSFLKVSVAILSILGRRFPNLPKSPFHLVYSYRVSTSLKMCQGKIAKIMIIIMEYSLFSLYNCTALMSWSPALRSSGDWAAASQLPQGEAALNLGTAAFPKGLYFYNFSFLMSSAT